MPVLTVMCPGISLACCGIIMKQPGGQKRRNRNRSNVNSYFDDDDDADDGGQVQSSAAGQQQRGRFIKSQRASTPEQQQCQLAFLSHPSAFCTWSSL